MWRTLYLAFFISFGLNAQVDYGGPAMITCSMRDTAENALVLAPDAFLEGTAVPSSEFILNFSDSVPAVAQAAMQFAAGVWSTHLISDVPIVIDVDWEDRGDNRLLASAGPATLFRGFQGAEPDVWYPVALAESIAGRNLNEPGEADIVVNANSTANWYFGTDGNTPRRQIDLVSVMLHELGHGLGFLSSVDTINENQLAIGFGTRFIVYDLFLETPDGVPLTDESFFVNPSEELLMAATANNLRFTGEAAAQRNDGAPVRLFSPALFDAGSSVSHLNENTFPPGTENALMTPFLSAGEAVHRPGPVTLGIFTDIGWSVRFDLVGTRAAAPLAVRVYPNPASEILRLELPPATAPRTVSFFTMAGIRAGAQVLGINEENVSVSGLPPGTYVLLVQDERESWRGRVVVN